MLMKDILKEKGVVDNNTVSITCPHCKSSALIDPLKMEYVTPISHDVKCHLLNACRVLEIDHTDLKDERVKKYIFNHFKVEKLFP